MTTEPGATVAVRVPLAPGPTTRVHTSYGVNPDHWSHLPRAALRFAVAVAADGRETTISESTLDPVYFRRDRRWPEVDVDLAPYAGRPVELVLRVTAPADVPPLDDRGIRRSARRRLIPARRRPTPQRPKSVGPYRSSTSAIAHSTTDASRGPSVSSRRAGSSPAFRRWTR